MKTICFFLLFLFTSALSSGAAFSGEVVYLPEDLRQFHRYAAYIEPYVKEARGAEDEVEADGRPRQGGRVDELVEKTALFFLGSPYAAHTLEAAASEKLVVNLREFDCVTFIETVIALTNTVRSGNIDFNEYIRQLEKVRYRDGARSGYASRLHYTSDWLYNHEQNGLLKNISGELGGIREGKTIHFMTSHRDAYRQLKGDDILLEDMRRVEEKMRLRGGFFYLPKDAIQAAAPQIPHMALLAFTTRIEGLDTTHTGFAYWMDGGVLTFIHASSSQGEVVMERSSLSGYCAAQPSCTGIVIARLL